MIYKRMKHTKQDWWELVFPVLLTLNNKKVSSSTGFTPKDAMKPSNQLQVKINLELKSKHQRNYPNIKIDDYVKY